MRIRRQLNEQPAAFTVVQQCSAKVPNHAAVSGEYFPHLPVEYVFLVDLKTVKDLDDAHRMRCTGRFKTTALRLCLPLNFSNPRLPVKPMVNGQ